MTRVVKRMADMDPEQVLDMTTKELLAHPEMKAAKKRFELGRARSNSTLKWTFRKFLTYCLAGGNKPQGLGLVDSKVSGERLRQLYVHYLSNILGIPSLRELAAIRAKMKREQRLKENTEKSYNSDSSLGLVAREAEKAGLVVAMEPYKNKGALGLMVLQRVIILNGHRWLIQTRRTLHLLVNAPNNYLTSFYFTQDMLSIIPPIQGVIAVLNVPGYPSCTYVFPRDFIECDVLCGAKRRHKIYLPNQPTGRRRAKRDYSQYKNAWHLAA